MLYAQLDLIKLIDTYTVKWSVNFPPILAELEGLWFQKKINSYLLSKQN